jgi:hypothetical protein
LIPISISLFSFSPYRTYAGEVGGIRSTLAVDTNNLKPYYSSILICVHQNAWTETNPTLLKTYVRDIDFSGMELDLRGFSDAIRVGRYAYLSPLTSGENIYSSKMIRINLGPKDIGTAIDAANQANNIRGMADILDFSMVNLNLAGYSGIFSAGQYLFLVPYRNSYIPANGQRGHGNVVRLNMNSFNKEGVEFVDVSNTTRNQIPSFFDINLRGFSYGFACKNIFCLFVSFSLFCFSFSPSLAGQYAFLVPFFNADFNGKLTRFFNLKSLSDNLQELDLVIDRGFPNVFKGYRGGFVSIWYGLDT